MLDEVVVLGVAAKAQAIYMLQGVIPLSNTIQALPKIIKRTENTLAGSSSFAFFFSSAELSLEWLCSVPNGGDGAGDAPDVVDVGVPPVSLLLLLSVVADDGNPTPSFNNLFNADITSAKSSSPYHVFIRTAREIRSRKQSTTTES
ncbi:Protein of unknown function [Gryllus bimaculatus]|nr:Protein of unknown function [Gryllus bimaculatus]